MHIPRKLIIIQKKWYIWATIKFSISLFQRWESKPQWWLQENYRTVQRSSEKIQVRKDLLCKGGYFLILGLIKKHWNKFTKNFSSIFLTTKRKQKCPSFCYTFAPLETTKYTYENGKQVNNIGWFPSYY